MSAQEQWSDEAIISLLRDVIADSDQDEQEPVSLAAERQNPVISWQEFSGDFT